MQSSTTKQRAGALRYHHEIVADESEWGLFHGIEQFEPIHWHIQPEQHRTWSVLTVMKLGRAWRRRTCRACWRLMQDYFTNTLQATPSPALLKALLINGARLETGYTYDVQNTLNDRGWGLVNLPNSLPAGITTDVNNGTGESMLMLDQSPANRWPPATVILIRSPFLTVPMGNCCRCG